MAREFIPALRFAALTPWYDRTVAWTTSDAAMKNRVVGLVDPKPRERVLDLGCGTGTLLLAMAHLTRDAMLTGVDADPAIIEYAAVKTKAAGMTVEFVMGFGDALPFPDAHFDVAVSTLFFHHLRPEAKRRTIHELRRVLRPGGRLVIADFGRAKALWRRVAFQVVRLLDGYANTRDHAAGTLASYFIGGGFADLQCIGSMPVLVGSIDFLVATRTAADNCN